MSSPVNRRDFLARSAALGAAANLGDFGFLRNLPPLSAAEVQVQPAVVQLSADIEPLVRLIEESPRNRLLEVVAERVHGGTSYQQLLSALMLAGVRGIKPPPVGFPCPALLVG